MLHLISLYKCLLLTRVTLLINQNGTPSCHHPLPYPNHLVKPNTSQTNTSREKATTTTNHIMIRTWNWGSWKRSEPLQCQWSWHVSSECLAVWAGSPSPLVCPICPRSWKKIIVYKMSVVKYHSSLFWARMNNSLRNVCIYQRLIDINSNFPNGVITGSVTITMSSAWKCATFIV